MGQSAAVVRSLVVGAVLSSGAILTTEIASANLDMNVQSPPPCTKSTVKMRGADSAIAMQRTETTGNCGPAEAPETSSIEKAVEAAPDAPPKDTKISEKDLGSKSPAKDGQKPSRDNPVLLNRGEMTVEGYLGSSYVYGTLSGSKQGILEGYLMRPNGGRFYVYGFPETSSKGRVAAYDMSGNYITLQVADPKQSEPAEQLKQR